MVEGSGFNALMQISSRRFVPCQVLHCLAALVLITSLANAQTTMVEDLAFDHRPEALRSGVFYNDRFASNRWTPGMPIPSVPSSHYAYFSEQYIQGLHEATKAFGLWQYATLATNGVAQGNYAAGKAAFMNYLRHSLASPGRWLAEDCARKSKRTVIQVSLMPWYLSESANTTLVESPIMHAHRRMYTSQADYRDLVKSYAYELITTVNWTGRVRYWEGPINEPQRYWRGNLNQLSQLYRDFAQSVKEAEDAAVAAGLSTGSYKIGGTSPAAWWMAITHTDSPPGPLDGPNPGGPSPLAEINRKLVLDHLMDPATPLDFLSWHQVRTASFAFPDKPYPGLPESNFNGAEPGWCSTAMNTARGWVSSVGGDPDAVEYILTEWYNGLEGSGTPSGIYAAVTGLSARANIARNDLGGEGFALANRTVWEDWANVANGSNTGPGIYHKVGRYPKPLMTLHRELHRLGNMDQVHVEHTNYVSSASAFGAAIHGRTGGNYMVVQGSSYPWTLQLQSSRKLTVTRVTRMNGATPYPGSNETPPAPAMSISIPAAAWDVLIVEYQREGPNAWCGFRNGSGINAPDYKCLAQPVVGGTWTATFGSNPSTIINLLAGSLAAPVTSPTPWGGEFLIALQPAPILFQSNGDFTVAVPNLPTLIGSRIRSQGFRIEGNPSTVVPLNALDLLLGY